MLRFYLSRAAKRESAAQEPPLARRGLLSLRTTVIFAVATAGSLAVGHWSQPEFGFGAWIGLVIGLDQIIDP
jgi:hypothetical protein